MDSLVTVGWLAEERGADDLVVLDASWHLEPGRDAAREFAAAHIPDARFFDLDALVADDPRPHMLPDAAAFGAAMERLGVGRDDRIVIYDDSRLRTAARAWVMLRHFGARQVAILDGGLGAWRAAGLPLTSEPPAPRAARFEAKASGQPIALAEVAAALGHIPILDARGPDRFAGTAPEPRPGVQPGHMPGAINLPYARFYEEDGRWRDDAALAALFAAERIDPAAPFIATCGSGVTACTLLFAAHRLGGEKGRLYDGSWAEWGSDPGTAKVVGG